MGGTAGVPRNTATPRRTLSKEDLWEALQEYPEARLLKGGPCPRRTCGRHCRSTRRRGYSKEDLVQGGPVGGTAGVPRGADEAAREGPPDAAQGQPARRGGSQPAAAGPTVDGREGLPRVPSTLLVGRQEVYPMITDRPCCLSGTTGGLFGHGTRAVGLVSVTYWTSCRRTKSLHGWSDRWRRRLVGCKELGRLVLNTSCRCRRRSVG